MAQNPMRCADEVVTFISKWDVGATGAHTKTTGFPGTGFSGVARDSAGNYTITFQRGMPVGGLASLSFQHWAQAGTEPLALTPLEDEVVAETAGAAGTAGYEAWAIDDTPALTELPSGDKVTITAVFLKTVGT